MRIEWVAGVKVDLKKNKTDFFFVLKIYKDQLGSKKSEQQPFPGNGTRKRVGYFKYAN